MSKRNLFAEISESMGTLQAEREGRLILRRVALSDAVAPDVDGTEQQASYKKREVAILTSPNPTETSLLSDHQAPTTSVHDRSTAAADLQPQESITPFAITTPPA